jgi:4-hydroxythreonine-4-phosphate dehydrogenase
MLNIGITLGDPAGIGPEIVAKSINSIQPRNFKITLFGDRENYKKTLEICKINPGDIKNFDFINNTPPKKKLKN